MARRDGALLGATLEAENNKMASTATVPVSDEAAEHG